MSSADPNELPKHVNDYLSLGKQVSASDVHLSVSSPPTCRRYGSLLPMWENAPLLSAEDTEDLVKSFLNEQQMQRLLEMGDVDFAYTNENGRYRTSVVRQRLGYDLAFRIIDSALRTLDELQMPPQLKLLTQYQNGLVLVTGPMGSGKTTTLAALVQEINSTGATISSPSKSRSNTSSPPRVVMSPSARYILTRNLLRLPCVERFVRIPMSSWSEKCAILKPSNLPSPHLKPAISCSEPFTPAMRPAHSTDSLMSSRQTSATRSE